MITGVRLRLVPLQSRRAVALLAVEDAAAAVEVAGRLRRTANLLAAELFFDDGMLLV